MRRDKVGKGSPGKIGVDRLGKPRLCNICGDKDQFIQFGPTNKKNIMSTVGNMLQRDPGSAAQILYELYV